MTTAREVVAQALYEVEVSGEGWSNRTAADAVLAALREHWTSDEEVNRISKDFHAGWYALVIAALFEEEPK